jgi:hypothetical protein
MRYTSLLPANVIPPKSASTQEKTRSAGGGDANPLMQKWAPETRSRAAAATDEGVSQDKYNQGKSQGP